MSGEPYHTDSKPYQYPKPVVRIDGIPYYIKPPPCIDYMHRVISAGHYWQEQWRDHNNTTAGTRSVCLRCGMRKQDITGEPTLCAYNQHPRDSDSGFGDNREGVLSV